MPIALDRDELAAVSLRGDEHKPLAERPAFLFYHLTRKERRKVDELRTRAEACTTDAEVEPIIREIIDVGLAGWRNMVNRRGEPIPFSAGAVEEVLTPAEMIELAWTYPERVTELEKKRRSESALPSTSNTDASAPAASQSATTPPPPPGPTSSTASPVQTVAALAV